MKRSLKKIAGFGGGGCRISRYGKATPLIFSGSSHVKLYISTPKASDSTGTMALLTAPQHASLGSKFPTAEPKTRAENHLKNAFYAISEAERRKHATKTTQRNAFWGIVGRSVSKPQAENPPKGNAILVSEATDRKRENQGSAAESADIPSKTNSPPTKTTY